jgi:integrase
MHRAPIPRLPARLEFLGLDIGTGDDEIASDPARVLRRLQREQGLSSHVFMTERDGPMTPKAFHALFGRIGSRAKMQFPIHPHMLRHGCGRSALLAQSRSTTR